MIYIILEGGFVRDICTDQKGLIDLPKFCVIDYDTDGMEDSVLVINEGGDTACLSYFEGDDIEEISPLTFKPMELHHD
jgi:hypothetical protein